MKNIDKSILYMMVGLPGSGKTQQAHMLAKEINAEVLTISEIRKELSQENPNIAETEVFATMNVRAKAIIADNCNVVIDSTNIKSFNRSKFLSHIQKEIPCKAICVVMATPYEICLKNNANRINSDYIKGLYFNWETPAYWEGWDEIWLNYEHLEWASINGNCFDFICNYKMHDLGDKAKPNYLGTHCVDVYHYLEDEVTNSDISYQRKASLLTAAMIHDCGKLATKSMVNGKVVYYHHSNVGAYESLFFGPVYKDVDKIYISNLINYHMHFYDGRDKCKNNRNALCC